jgi:hypothetical protein
MQRMMIEPAGKRGVTLTLSVALLLIVPITAGCLSEDEPLDLSEWYVAMTVERFETNGEKAVNVTELLFDVRFGDVTKDTWRIQETGGFFKEDTKFVPIRIEARYDDGVNPVEDFPIIGSSDVVTGAITFVDGDQMKLDMDGPEDLIDQDKSIDRYPHGYERTVRLTGDYGVLVLYFNLNEPS